MLEAPIGLVVAKREVTKKDQVIKETDSHFPAETTVHGVKKRKQVIECPVPTPLWA